MKSRDDRPFELKRKDTRTGEVTEMHLFDTDATEEKALCGADTSADYRRGVNCYLEDRLDGNWIGTVCEGCKSVAASFAVNRSRDLEAGGLLDEAQEYRQLADTLVRETGLGRFSG